MTGDISHGAGPEDGRTLGFEILAARACVDRWQGTCGTVATSNCDSIVREAIKDIDYSTMSALFIVLLQQ